MLKKRSPTGGSSGASLFLTSGTEFRHSASDCSYGRVTSSSLFPSLFHKNILPASHTVLPELRGFFVCLEGCGEQVKIRLTWKPTTGCGAPWMPVSFTSPLLREPCSLQRLWERPVEDSQAQELLAKVLPGQQERWGVVRGDISKKAASYYI